MAAWSLAVPDWRERIRTGRSLLPDLPHLDQAQARRAVAIFNKLRLPDVVGTPALAEAGADWFREIVGALHGSFDLGTRERMIREVFLLAPKKNSKRLDHADRWPVVELVEQIKELGQFGATVSPDYGGLGLPARTYAEAVMRISSVWMSLTWNVRQQ